MVRWVKPILFNVSITSSRLSAMRSTKCASEPKEISRPPSAKYLLKISSEGNVLCAEEWAILGVGCLVAFVVSLLVIRYLMDYVRRHSFSAFGVYRIVLGALVLGYFLLKN